MIFEKGWFLHKMNKYAPRGYKFVAEGDDGRIAMRSRKIMGTQMPRGPFISSFSFDMLDTLYGGLLTRRSGKICQAATAGEYTLAFDIARAKPRTDDEAENAKHDIYSTIVHKYAHVWRCPYPIMIHKNAILVQAMQDAKATLPNYLTERVQKYVNNCTWYAIERVLSSMPICDLKYYQEQYRNTMAALGVEYGQTFGALDIDKIASKKRSEQLTIAIEELTYDILPKQERALQRATNKETAPEKLQTLQKQLATTKNKITQMSEEKRALEPAPVHMPARQLLANDFYKNNQPVVPTMAKHPFAQMLQLALMRQTKQK